MRAIACIVVVVLGLLTAQASAGGTKDVINAMLRDGTISPEFVESFSVQFPEPTPVVHRDLLRQATTDEEFALLEQAATAHSEPQAPFFKCADGTMCPIANGMCCIGGSVCCPPETPCQNGTSAKCGPRSAWIATRVAQRKSADEQDMRQNSEEGRKHAQKILGDQKQENEAKINAQKTEEEKGKTREDVTKKLEAKAKQSHEHRAKAEENGRKKAKKDEEDEKIKLAQAEEQKKLNTQKSEEANKEREVKEEIKQKTKEKNAEQASKANSEANEKRHLLGKESSTKRTEAGKKQKTESADKTKIAREQYGKRKREAAEKREARAKRAAEQARKNKEGNWCHCHYKRTYFNRRNRWEICRHGSYITGFYRNAAWLYGIRYFRCCYPCQGRKVMRPTHCYTHNWVRSFDRAGWSWCRNNYFITGLYKSSCNRIYCIEYARCCRFKSRGRRRCQVNRRWYSGRGSFDRNGWVWVSGNRFLQGMYRSRYFGLWNIEYGYQCTWYYH